MRDPWGRVDGRGWVDQASSPPAPRATATRGGDGSPDPGAAPSRGRIEEGTMEPRRLTHTIHQIERICHGCWEVVRREHGNDDSSPRLGRSRKESAFRSADLPDGESHKGQEHVGKAGNTRRRVG